MAALGHHTCANVAEMWVLEEEKKFIFVSRVIESHSRPIKAKWRKIWLEWSSPWIW